MGVDSQQPMTDEDAYGNKPARPPVRGMKPPQAA